MKFNKGRRLSGDFENLLALEEKKKCHILYACEAGSRAWGIASKNSDYDIRFIYIKDIDWYLSINKKRDTIVKNAIQNDLGVKFLDFVGWDLKKALGLFRKGNAALVEWFNSPICYIEDLDFTERFTKLLDEYYNPVAACYHYYHMARGNAFDMESDTIVLKRYLYVLKPLLIVKWIEVGKQAPINFFDLIEIIDGSLFNAIKELAEAKTAGLGRGPKISVIDQFIDRELKRLEEKRFQDDLSVNKPPIETCNQLFRSMVWRDQK